MKFNTDFMKMLDVLRGNFLYIMKETTKNLQEASYLMVKY